MRQSRRLKPAGEHKEKGLRLLTDRAVNNRWSVTRHEEEMWSSTPLSAFVIVFELLSNSEGLLFVDEGCLCSGSDEQRISSIILGPKFLLIHTEHDEAGELVSLTFSLYIFKIQLKT